MKNKTTELIPEYKGAMIVYCSCSICKQTMQYPTERPFNHCPYCGKKVVYKEEK